MAKPTHGYRYGTFSVHKVIAVLDQDAHEELEFRRRKDEYGSLYAFHGTKTDCAYSIFRNGLRDLSNSHLMTTGAAMGAGIYVALDIATAAGYSRTSQSNGYMYGAPVLPTERFLLVIEFINEPSYNKRNRIYVISEQKDIRIRFFLIEKPQSGTKNKARNINID